MTSKSQDYLEDIKSERLRTGKGVESILEYSSLPKGLSKTRVTNILYGLIKNISQEEYDFIMSRYALFPNEKRVKLTKPKIDKIKQLIADKNIPKAEISKSFARYEGFNVSILKTWLSGDIKTAKESHFKGVMQFLESYEPPKKVRIYDDLQSDDDFVPISQELRDFIQSEIDRTGLGPQRALKGNTKAKEIGLTSGIIYRILGKNGKAKTAKKEHIELFKELWKSR
ncbi:hypothetical protein AWW68_00310 [Roseivirga spongicola]|uniref:Uncharacterized protein n=2 Tax=Roseivirga spongicola TaxID=333140 RepID=A0A150XEX6_9BACT|nr:hypothetical protein [Roseivirga sp.]KYG77246.1 hypothetical protein AWW68_00310 [Roseivirga spongicola]MBO6662667.1 hypothetical protein [Roseivirga sp.]MBO6759794.1 hypothetical protein [Roseivirga sp.]MBO6909674.1 hypothetical protein [Roseivirga sp.]